MPDHVLTLKAYVWRHIHKEWMPDRLAKSTRFPGRLPVFHHFLPVLGIPISKKICCIFTVNIGEIRETT